jgi:hypothetical protein
MVERAIVVLEAVIEAGSYPSDQVLRRHSGTNLVL